MIAGGCLCGAVRFELTEEPAGAGYCHCTRCQRRTGAAASPSAGIDPATLRITQGAERVREWRPPDGFAKCFCGECGSHLFARSPDGTRMGVRLGALDPGHGLRPSFRQHLDSAAGWEPVPDDGLERFGGPRG